MKSWLRDFISSCLRRLKIPKIWRRALVVAIPKPGKPVGDPKSYRLISLLCVLYKILERLIYARVEPLTDSLLPKEQSGYRRKKSIVDQVVLLTQNIEDSFEAKKKGGAVFVNLTAAYDTVWHRGITCKLLRLLPDKHMVKMIMELVRNRSFTLTTGDSNQSRLRRLKNAVSQRSVLAPLLFNIYTYDLSSMISRKFSYADDLALLHSSGNWKDLEGTLSKDMSTLSAYLQTWMLKLSHTKTVTAAFHLNSLHPTRTDHLLVLSGMQPVELSRMGATLSLAHRGSLDPDHILQSLLSGSSDTRQVILRSRRPFVPGARNLLDNLARLGIRASEWTNHKWKTKYCKNASRLRAFVPETGARSVGMGLPEQLALSSTACGLVWAIPFFHAQMGSRSFIELRVWRL